MLISRRTSKELAKHARCIALYQRNFSEKAVVSEPWKNVDSLAAPKAQFSLFDAVFKSSSTPQVSLDQVYDYSSTFETGSFEKPEIHTSKLDSGMRVISVEHDIPYASVGIFADAGSCWEDASNNGVSHFLQTMAFDSTKNRTGHAFAHDMLNISAQVNCIANREHTIYCADVLPEHLPAMVSGFGDVIQNHIFHRTDIKEAQTKYKELLKDMEAGADIQIMEAIHAAAYSSSPLGNSLYCNPDMFNTFTSDYLQDHMKNTFTGPRMVCAGVGVDHGDLVALCADAFDSIGTEPGTKPANVYTGGEARVRADAGGLVHIALGFESVDWHSDDLIPLCVLQTMMGGGGSFSAGGPGKGMYSRLYENILNTYGWVESANSFTSIFGDSSIFGIYGIVEGPRAHDMIEVMLRELVNTASPVQSVELGRAKNALRSAVFMQLETRPLIFEDLGKQYLTYDKIYSAADIAEKIDAVTGEDIQRVAVAMLKTPVSLASWGATQNVPRVAEVQQALG